MSRLTKRLHQAMRQAEHGYANKYGMLLISIALFINGCGAAYLVSSAASERYVLPGFKPDPNRISQLRKIKVIPLESRPLDLVGGLPPSLSTQQFITAGQLRIEPSPMLLHAYAKTQPMAGENQVTLPKITAIPQQDPAWMPNLVLAHEVSSQIRALSVFEVAPITRYYKLPIDYHRPTVSVYDRARPIAHWYNEMEAVVQYGGGDGSAAEAIVEIGLWEWTYDSTANTLRIQVLAKIIDPISRKVLGRARNWKFQRVVEIKELLANDAARLKQVFGGTSRDLVTASLKDLGLIPR